MTLRFDLPLPADAYPLVRFRPGKSNNSAQYRTRSGALSPAGKYAAGVPGKMAARGEICFQPSLV